MKVRIVAAAYIEVEDEEDFEDLLSLGEEEILEQLSFAQDVSFNIERVNEEDETCLYCSCELPSDSSFSVCDECRENLGTDQ